MNKRNQNVFDRNFELILTFVIAFILSMPILSYVINRLSGHRQDKLFIYGFFISGTVCFVLAVYKFIRLIFDYRHLRFTGIVKLAVTKNLDYLLFFIYVIWIFASVAYHGFTKVGVFGLSFKREGWITFTLYVFIFFAASFINKGSYKAFLAYVFAIGAAVLATLGSFVNLSANPGETAERIMLSGYIGVFSNNNHHGYYLAMSGALMMALTVFLRPAPADSLASAKIGFRNPELPENSSVFTSSLIWRIVFLAGFAFTVVLVFFADSFGALLSLEIGVLLICVIYAVVKKGIKFKIIALISAVISMIVFVYIGKLGDSSMANQTSEFFTQVQDIAAGEAKDNFGTQRWQLWRLTVDAIREKPLFGWNSDGIWYWLERETGGIAQRTHNEYLQQTAFYGLIAGLSYTIGCFMVYWRALRNRKKLRACDIAFLAGGFAYLAGAFFGVTMVQVYPMFMAVLGLAVTENTDDV